MLTFLLAVLEASVEVAGVVLAAAAIEASKAEQTKG